MVHNENDRCRQACHGYFQTEFASGVLWQVCMKLWTTWKYLLVNLDQIECHCDLKNKTTSAITKLQNYQNVWIHWTAVLVGI